MAGITWHTEAWAIKDLKAMEGNPNVMDDKQWKELGKSIDQFGYVETVVINVDGTIIGGNHRVDWLVQKGYWEETIDVRVPDRALTEKEMSELNIRLNQNRGQLDIDKLLDFNLDPAELLEIGVEDWQLGYGMNPSQEEVGEGNDINLPTGGRNEFEQMTFTLHTEQGGAVKRALEVAKQSAAFEDLATYGNENGNGNALYLIVKEWLETKE